MKYFIKVLKDYATFTGRARRKEYWMFYLVNTLIFTLLALPGTILRVDALYYPLLIYTLAILVPWLAVRVRRLHDIGKSGWYLLFNGIPYVGSIIMFVWACKKGEVGENQYGPDPKSEEEAN